VVIASGEPWRLTEDDVEAVLKPIWNAKHETADRLRGRIENVFDYAKSKKYRDGDNPAAWKGTGRAQRLAVRRQADGTGDEISAVRQARKCVVLQPLRTGEGADAG